MSINLAEIAAISSAIEVPAQAYYSPSRFRDARLMFGLTKAPVLLLSKKMQNAGEAPAEGFVTDIGAEGIGIILNRSIESGTEITLSLNSGGNVNLPQDIEVTVASAKPLPSARQIIKRAQKTSWRISVRVTKKLTSAQAQFLHSLLMFTGAQHP